MGVRWMRDGIVEMYKVGRCYRGMGGLEVSLPWVLNGSCLHVVCPGMGLGSCQDKETQGQRGGMCRVWVEVKGLQGLVDKEI